MHLKRAVGVILHAPNVHTGGGLVLLADVFHADNARWKFVQLDLRSVSALKLPVGTERYYVRRSVASRLWAEWRLLSNVRAGEVVLCFHGLPPLFRLSGKSVVFIQNRLLVDNGPIAGFSFGARMRLRIERLWLRLCKRHASRYVVQTPSMLAATTASLGDDIEVVVCPFLGAESGADGGVSYGADRKFDFVYVASGEPHKNHATLLAAWRVLSELGFRPSLALTIDDARYPKMAAAVAKAQAEFRLNVVNLGALKIGEVSRLYQVSGALIYPSLAESLGLPLIEAARYGLPILAPEQDYVRDVVCPVETFDARSARSIARAVRRFLGSAERVHELRSVSDFLTEVVK